MKVNIFILIAITLICSKLNAQLLINGAQFLSTTGSIVYVNNDSLLIENNGLLMRDGFLLVDKDIWNNSGNFDIDGRVEIEENFINNDQTEGFSNNSIVQLKGNWTNNSSFIPGESTVILAGNTQIIDGSENTTYYNLEALGNLADVKTLVGVDIEVLNELDLGDVELATDENTASVLNPNPNAIVRNNGFVSSLDVGRLERLTNSTNTYLFPTGSTFGTTRYRPIELTPSSNNIQTFGVRLANIEATIEGFDVATFTDSLCGVNPNFYHRIYGDAVADITMFYEPANDGEWDAMAQWQAADEWDKLPNESTGTSAGFSTITIESWDDFDIPAFALAIKKPFFELDEEVTIASGETIELEPIYVGPIPEEIVWTPFNDLSCDDCLNPKASPTSTTDYTIVIDVNQFCRLEKSIRVQILDRLLLPDAFTPNGDGVNDVFQVVNGEFYDNIEMRIYNRWGELIHQGVGDNHGWDGVYKGKEQGIGVYIYYVEAERTNSEKLVLKGNVSLIR